MALEDEAARKLRTAPRIRDITRQLPGRGTTPADAFSDITRTIDVQNEAILMIAREVDKLRSTP